MSSRLHSFFSTRRRPAMLRRASESGPHADHPAPSPAPPPAMAARAVEPAVLLTPTSPRDTPRLKCPVLGSRESHKASLVQHFARRANVGSSSHAHSTPLFFENTLCTVALDGAIARVELSLWDPAPYEPPLVRSSPAHAPLATADLVLSRNFTYHHADVFVVCFSFQSRESFELARDAWLPDIDAYYASASASAAGTGAGAGAHAPSAPTSPISPITPRTPLIAHRAPVVLLGLHTTDNDGEVAVSSAEGRRLADDFDVSAYFECASTFYSDTHAVFEEVARVALRHGGGGNAAANDTSDAAVDYRGRPPTDDLNATATTIVANRSFGGVGGGGGRALDGYDDEDRESTADTVVAEEETSRFSSPTTPTAATVVASGETPSPRHRQPRTASHATQTSPPPHTSTASPQSRRRLQFGGIVRRTRMLAAAVATRAGRRASTSDGASRGGRTLLREQLSDDELLQLSTTALLCVHPARLLAPSLFPRLPLEVQIDAIERGVQLAPEELAALPPVLIAAMPLAVQADLPPPALLLLAPNDAITLASKRGVAVAQCDITAFPGDDLPLARRAASDARFARLSSTAQLTMRTRTVSAPVDSLAAGSEPDSGASIPAAAASESADAGAASASASPALPVRRGTATLQGDRLVLDVVIKAGMFSRAREESVAVPLLQAIVARTFTVEVLPDGASLELRFLAPDANASHSLFTSANAGDSAGAHVHASPTTVVVIPRALHFRSALFSFLQKCLRALYSLLLNSAPRFPLLRPSKPSRLDALDGEIAQLETELVRCEAVDRHDDAMAIADALETIRKERAALESRFDVKTNRAREQAHHFADYVLVLRSYLPPLIADTEAWVALHAAREQSSRRAAAAAAAAASAALRPGDVPPTSGSHRPGDVDPDEARRLNSEARLRMFTDMRDTLRDRIVPALLPMLDEDDHAAVLAPVAAETYVPSARSHCTSASEDSENVASANASGPAATPAARSKKKEAKGGIASLKDKVARVARRLSLT